MLSDKKPLTPRQKVYLKSYHASLIVSFKTVVKEASRHPSTSCPKVFTQTTQMLREVREQQYRRMMYQMLRAELKEMDEYNEIQQ